MNVHAVEQATKASGQDKALARLLSLIEERRLHYQDAMQLDADTVAAMQEAGVYRALLPARFGGDERSPADFLRLIEAISIADGSAGWVASFGVSHCYLASLPLETLEAIYADGPDVVFAGALFPPQPAEAVDGGYRVSGRWSFGSGSPGASLIGVGIKGRAETGGLPVMAVMPAKQVEIVPNWDVIGMRGTGSHDLKVDQVFVPDEWTFVRGSPATIDLPVYHYPSMALAAQVLAVVGLGVARAAINHIATMATNRASITGAPLMAERAHVQIGLAQAEAALSSARAFFFEITEYVYDLVLRGTPVPREDVVRIRLAASNAAKVGAEVARRMFAEAGTAGIFTSNPLSRYLQDAAVVGQHAFLTEGTWQSAGQGLLGLATPPGFP